MRLEKGGEGVYYLLLPPIGLFVDQRYQSINYLQGEVIGSIFVPSPVGREFDIVRSDLPVGSGKEFDIPLIPGFSLTLEVRNFLTATPYGNGKCKHLFQQLEVEQSKY